MKEIDLTNDIEFKNCSFFYDEETKLNILKNINLKFKKNEFIGIIGESGSGKTTFLIFYWAYIFFCEGEVLIDKQKINTKIKWKNIVGYVPQNIFLIDDSFKNNIILDNNSDKIDQSYLDNTIKNAQLEKLIENLPDGIHTKIGERGSRLSVGQIQRIGIARALYVNPDILFFDEATSSLDPKTEKDLIDVINKFKGKKTIFMISHKESILQSCDRILKIDQGNIIEQYK